MNANPVIPNGPDGYHVNVAFKLLAESISQSRKAPVVHSHRQIAALNIACRNVLQIGVAFDTMLLDSDALSRAILALGAIRRSAIDLVQDGVIYVTAKGTLNSLQIGLVAICGQLDTVFDA